MPEESNAESAFHPDGVRDEDDSKIRGSSDTVAAVAGHGEGDGAPQVEKGITKRRRMSPQALSPKRKATAVEFFAQ